MHGRISHEGQKAGMVCAPNSRSLPTVKDSGLLAELRRFSGHLLQQPQLRPSTDQFLFSHIMFPSASRALLRRPQIARLTLRNASTTSEAANAASSAATKTKESASQVASQASQGLTRVSSSASSGASRAGSAVSSTLSSIGGRTSQVLNFAQCKPGPVQEPRSAAY